MIHRVFASRFGYDRLERDRSRESDFWNRYSRHHESRPSILINYLLPPRVHLRCVLEILPANHSDEFDAGETDALSVSLVLNPLDDGVDRAEVWEGEVKANLRYAFTRQGETQSPHTEESLVAACAEVPDSLGKPLGDKRLIVGDVAVQSNQEIADADDRNPEPRMSQRGPKVR